MAWKRDLPEDAREVWDILAKALMMRAGGSVTIPPSALKEAAETQAEIAYADDGSIVFRIERN